MHKNEYIRFILKEYNTSNELFSKYMRIDAMKQLLIHVNWPSKTFFKGAASLLLDNKYQRDSNITKDLDFSIISSISKYKAMLKKELSISTERYKYKFLGYKDLVIATSGYSGFKASISYSIIGTNIKDVFHLDFAIEELEDIPKIVSRLNPLLSSYSIEQTIAEKFVSMIHHNKSNGRRKDFEDLKALYSNLNIELFNLIVKKFIKTKNITKEQIIFFKSQYMNYKYVLEFNLNSIIAQILKNLG